MTAVAPLGGTDDEGYVIGGTPNIQNAWQLLAGGAPRVAKVLIDIAEHGASEPARVAAATTVLKFVGFGGPDVVQIQRIPSQFDEAAAVGSGVRSSRQVIEARLAQLREPAYDPNDADPTIVDAEIVEPDE